MPISILIINHHPTKINVRRRHPVQAALMIQ